MSEQSDALRRCKTTFKVTVFRRGKTKQVLFLEAGKDFVDILFSFLLLPVGTILHILSQGIQVKPLSGIANIFGSVDSSILHVDKQDLLQPRPSSPGCICRSSGELRLQRILEATYILQSPPARGMLPEDYFKCTCRLCSGKFLSSDRGERCQSCKSQGYTGHFHEGPYSAHQKDPHVKETRDSISGLVKENIKFIVTDKLEIMPSTTITTVSVLKEVEVASLDDLESNEFAVSMTQILQVLHSALTKNTACLNDVFGVMK